MTTEGPERRGFEGAVRQIARLAQAAGAATIAHEASDLAARLREDRFFVVCLGQYKRGKSSLLNALVGEPILPVGVAPITSSVTVLRHGSERAATVRFTDGGRTHVRPEDIADFVTEERNPRNAKRVAAVELFLPAPVLAHGLCLVDTPGIGSPFQWNDEVTREFVPQIDGALVVLGADPPISGDELALVREVAREVDEIVLVLNKADRVPPEDVAEAANFTGRAIAELLGRPAPKTLRVSAAERSVGLVTRDWARLEAYLEELSSKRRPALVAAAGRRGLQRLVARLDLFVGEEIGALERPIEESEERVRRLERWRADAEVSLRQLRHLLDAEEQWVERQVVEEGQAFLRRVSPAAAAALREAILTDRAHRGMALRPWACETATRISQRHVRDWLDEEQEHAEKIYRESAGRLVELSNEFLARLSRSLPQGLTMPLAELPVEIGFRERSRFFHTDMMHLAPASILARLRDSILPVALARRICLRDAQKHLLRVLEVNGARAMNDLRDRVRESRRSIEAEIRLRLEGHLQAAATALEIARSRRAEGKAAVQEELSRLASLRLELAALATELA